MVLLPYLSVRLSKSDYWNSPDFHRIDWFQRIVEVEKEVTRVVEAMAKPRVKLTYWYAADSPELLKVFQEQLLVFQTAHPEIELSPELIANLADLRSKIVSSKSAGVGPDVTYGNNGMPQDYYVAGWLQHLQNYYDEWSRKGDIPERPNQPSQNQARSAFADDAICGVHR